MFPGPVGKPINLDALAADVIVPLLTKTGARWHGWHAYLRDSRYEIDGVKFYGSPWVLPWAGAFNLPSEELKEKWDAIPSDVDVLVTHQPPEGILDNGQGCKHLRQTLGRLPNLRLCVFGHVHETSGIQKQNSTVFCNAAHQVCTIEL
jgi:Icc-related predicted phosphoesterase